MSVGGYEYTLYFAWCPPETPWDVSLARFDEDVFDFLLEHDEGQIPSITVVIRNPRIGFISPSRLYWCWVSFSYEACGPLPLFFGRLIGIPEEIEDNTVQIKFVARDTDYIFQKQRVARSLKIAPNYDELFLDVMKRDDPDAVLEGWSALYHVDRISGRVSASDILIGEDGVVHFAARDVFYDSVKCRILQSPLKAVNVKMEVHWAQQYQGSFYVGQWAYPTIGTEPFIGEWPKSGSSLGGGWHVGVAWAGERDPAANPAAPFNTETALINQKPSQISTTYQWTNTSKKHQTGDTMSISINYTEPFGIAVVLKEVDQFGIINPYAVDINGDPAPINQPAHILIDWLCYKTLALRFDGKQALATLGLCYQADRKRSERLEMTIQSDVQPVLTDPLVTEDTEEITLRSGDLSVPLVKFLNWDTVGMGEHVDLGTIVFPDNPLVPGQTSSQICVQAGNTGVIEPIFSNIAGQTTADGTVIWASLGDTPPTETVQDWVRGARVPLGTMIIPRPVSGVPDMESLLAPGRLTFPPKGVPVAKYSIYSNGYDGPGASMQECTVSGMVGGPPNTGEPAQFHYFTNPSGQYMYICIRSGVSDQFHPSFTGAYQVAEGSVVWQSLGPVQLPIGGWPGMTPARAFFPTDRGRLCVQHGMCRARAKLRKRGRAVEVSFGTRFEVGALLSCRMNGTIDDERLPGGTATGKVISYKLRATATEDDGGIFDASVVLGCSVGKVPIMPGAMLRDTVRLLLVTDTGVPSYVGVAGPVNGYVKPGYQRYYSSLSGSTSAPVAVVPPVVPPTPINWPILPPTLPPETCPPLASTWSSSDHMDIGNDIGYTPPISDPNDDGIIFGYGSSGLLLGYGWHGMAAHVTDNNIKIQNLQIEQAIHDAIASSNTTKELALPAIGGVATGTQTIPVTPFYDIQMAVQIALLQKQPEGLSLWFEMSLAPLTNGPFSSSYVVQTTPLQLPQTVDLSAPSSGSVMHA